MKTQDGKCTLWFNGKWTVCCVKHDYDIMSGVPWFPASIELYKCVWNKSCWFNAALMFAGVNLYYYSGLRWLVNHVSNLLSVF